MLFSCLLLLQGTPPIDFSKGGWLGLVAFLFIINFIQNYDLKRTNQEIVTKLKEYNEETVAKLTELIKAITDGNEKQSETLSGINNKQEVLASTQTSIASNVNMVIKDLINVIRDEK